MGTKPIIVILATSWGTKSGGINSFNMDLTIALSALLINKYQVVCMSLNATSQQIDDAWVKNVILISLDNNADEVFPVDSIDKLWRLLSEKINQPVVEWWIGHDVSTGDVANELKALSRQGSSAVIMHMSYLDYTGYKHGAQYAQTKHSVQEKVFRESDKHFAVGPLLQNRLNDFLGNGSAIMLIPGLHLGLSSKTTSVFTAVTFGRLDPENDKIKQGKLAVASFANAVKQARSNKALPACLRDNPRMFLFGTNGSSEEEELLKKYAEEKAGGVINIIPLPYTENRDELFDQLSKCNVALMLSWHEGFGLTGWEAISAEIPLIISEQSGLYKFIDEVLQGQGTGCVLPVYVEGKYGDEETANFQKKTLDAVSELILQCANSREKIAQNAKNLKKNLISLGFTWDKTAKTLAEGLGLILPESSSISPHIKKTQSIDGFAMLMKKLICFNQGEYIQYHYFTSEFHKRIKSEMLVPHLKHLDTGKLDELRQEFGNYLNRTLGNIVKGNFSYIEQYFDGRHEVKPRVCIKCSQIVNGEEMIVSLYRDRDINYKSDFPLGSNSGFVHVKETGTFFECTDIPRAIAEDKYKNSRVNIELAKNYWKKHKNNKSTEDIEWSSCWKTVEDNISHGTSYKSTLIVPMTLWNVSLDEDFRKVIGAHNAGRTIFGFLCFDHVESNFFNENDVNVGYIFADTLSQYFITRSIYTDFSQTYQRALQLLNQVDSRR